MKKLIMHLWAKFPFGYLARFEYGPHKITLYKNYWLDISDGDSHDMLPITLVSPELVKECGKQLKMRGY